MKTPWIIPLVLCAACGGHQPTEQKKDTVPDTPKVVKHIAADTPIVEPVAKMMDTVVSRPGKTLVFTTDLNYDSIPDTISLRTLARDPLAYDNITVSIAHHGRQSFKSASNWYQVDNDFPQANTDTNFTRYFYLARNGTETLLVLFGWVGEVERSEFAIIRINDNRPRLVFDQNHWKDNFIEVVRFVRDMDGDGRFEFGYGHLTEGISGPEISDGIITPYNPTIVYTVDDSLILNKPMMKKFNEESYVFAGYEPTDAIKVFCPEDRTKKCYIARDLIKKQRTR